ncbi:glutamine ABC transporter substrate-binding protein [Bacillus marinisedimentorum]|uniref:glutamine ABC transporter substrate-binding protein n=1 Tax=Bacillus marinisedimentorum TaxID=1821260 RepID=UPI000872416A|nr:glutamine ABC transporter substrate-binding protein [Bacillus marinisedimentorum]
MKKGMLFGFILLLFGAILSACGSDKYTVATDNSFVPFEFVDEEDGELKGFDIDLINAIAEDQGIEVEIEAMEFDGVIAGMQSGRYDIGIAGITITEERKESIEFSDPYYDAGLMIAVRGDDEEIKSEADLAGKKVGTRSGTTSEDYLKDNHPDAEIQAFPGIVEAYMDLQAGRLDAVLYDAPNVKYYIATEGGGDMKTVGDILQGEQYGIAMPKDSELVDKINEGLKNVQDNGTYDDIYEKWFDERPLGTEKSE